MPATVGLLEHWYNALRSPAGAKVRVAQGDRERAKQQLYKARKAALDPKLDTLSITDSPTAEDELWIVHSREPESGT